ncbi:MAG: glycosyltransferase, partial [Gammaproteobacteria bacterium]|nr:glycosyltransferase [Gammaproteobacteria bacterium]
MKISVVTVVRDAVTTIEDTLKSVISQDHPDVEHIIVDGASTDGTREVLDRYRSHVAQLVSEPDSGIYAAMNKGLRLAGGEVIGFLNADDVYAHAGVLTIIERVLADPELDACYADLVYVRRRDITQTIRYWTSQPFRPGLFEHGWLPAHPTFFVRRD